MQVVDSTIAMNSIQPIHQHFQSKWPISNYSIHFRLEYSDVMLSLFLSFYSSHFIFLKPHSTTHLSFLLLIQTKMFSFHHGFCMSWTYNNSIDVITNDQIAFITNTNSNDIFWLSLRREKIVQTSINKMLLLLKDRVLN